MTKVFLNNGTLIEVDDSIKSIHDARKCVLTCSYDIIAVKTKGDDSLIEVKKTYEDGTTGDLFICQTDWNPNTMLQILNWGKFQYEEKEVKPLYSYKMCDDCGTAVNTFPIFKIPKKYLFVEERPDGIFYCIGTASKDNCHKCGTNQFKELKLQGGIKNEAR